MDHSSRSRPSRSATSAPLVSTASTPGSRVAGRPAAHDDDACAIVLARPKGRYGTPPLIARREHGQRNAPGAADRLAALARRRQGHAACVHDAHVAPLLDLPHPAATKQLGDLLALVLIDLATKRDDREREHREK